MTDLVTRQQDSPRSEPLGLPRAAAQQLLTPLQPGVLQQQVDAVLAAPSHGQTWGATLQGPGDPPRSCRPVLGPFTLASPRRSHCRGTRRKPPSCRPLSALRTEAVAPELLVREPPGAARVSSGLTGEARTAFLPSAGPLDVKSGRHATRKGAERGAAERGEAPWRFIAGGPRDWGPLALPEGPSTVGIDGGDVREWEAKTRTFEVSVGQRPLACTRAESEQPVSSKCFAFVQTYDQKPKRRLFEVLQSQGHQLNQQITFLSDGGDTVRELQLYLNPHAEHLLDWLHLVRHEAA